MQALALALCALLCAAGARAQQVLSSDAASAANAYAAALTHDCVLTGAIPLRQSCTSPDALESLLRECSINGSGSPSPVQLLLGPLDGLAYIMRLLPPPPPGDPGVTWITPDHSAWDAALQRLAATRESPYTGLVLDPALVPDLVAAGALLNLQPYIAVDVATSNIWSSILSALRWRLAIGSPTGIFAVPMGAAAYVLHLRADVLAAHNLPTPSTWDQLLHVARVAHNAPNGPTAPRDPDFYGFCTLPSPSCHADTFELLAIFASIMQTRGVQQGAFFVPKSFVPLAGNNPGMAAAAAYYRALGRFAPPLELANSTGVTCGAMTGSASWLYRRGQCAFMIAPHPAWKQNHLLAAPAVRSHSRTVPLPGSSVMYDRDTRQLVACNTETCPLGAAVPAWPTDAAEQAAVLGQDVAARLSGNASFSETVMVNFAPVLGVSPLGIGVNAYASRLQQGMTVQYIRRLAEPEAVWALVLSPVTPISPFMYTHFGTTAITRWVQAGYAAREVAEYLTLSQTVLEHPNLVSSPHSMQRFMQYRDALHATAYTLLARPAVPIGDVLKALDAQLQVFFGPQTTSFSALRLQYAYSIGIALPDATYGKSSNATRMRDPLGPAHAIGAAMGFVGVALSCFLAGCIVARYRSYKNRKYADPGVGPSTTLVVSDVEGSTVLYEELCPAVMDVTISIHHDTVRRCIAATGGYESVTEGDSFTVAYPSAEAAMVFCLLVQTELLSSPWPDEVLAHELCRPVHVIHSKRLRQWQHRARNAADDDAHGAHAGPARAHTGQPGVAPHASRKGRLTWRSEMLSGLSRIRGAPAVRQQSFNPWSSRSLAAALAGGSSPRSPSVTQHKADAQAGGSGARAATAPGVAASSTAISGVPLAPALATLQESPSQRGRGGGSLGARMLAELYPIYSAVPSGQPTAAGDCDEPTLHGAVPSGDAHRDVWAGRSPSGLAAPEVRLELAPEDGAGATSLLSGGPVDEADRVAAAPGSALWRAVTRGILRRGAGSGGGGSAAHPSVRSAYSLQDSLRGSASSARELASLMRSGTGSKRNLASQAGVAAESEALAPPAPQRRPPPPLQLDSSTGLDFPSESSSSHSSAASTLGSNASSLGSILHYTPPHRHRSGAAATDRARGSTYGCELREKWSVLPEEQADDPSVAGAVLVFRGLRVRCGLTSGVYHSAEVNRQHPSGRTRYSGPVMLCAKAVSDAADGGTVVASRQSLAQCSQQFLARGDVLVWRLGDYVLGSPRLPATLYQVSNKALLLRTVLQKPLSRVAMPLTLGLFDAPLRLVGLAIASLGKSLVERGVGTSLEAASVFQALAYQHARQLGGYLSELLPGEALCIFPDAYRAALWAAHMHRDIEAYPWSAELRAHATKGAVRADASAEAHARLARRTPRMRAVVHWGSVGTSLHPVNGQLVYEGKTIDQARRMLARQAQPVVLVTEEAVTALRRCTVQGAMGGRAWAGGSSTSAKSLLQHANSEASSSSQRALARGQPPAPNSADAAEYAAALHTGGTRVSIPSGVHLSGGSSRILPDAGLARAPSARRLESRQGSASAATGPRRIPDLHDSLDQSPHASAATLTGTDSAGSEGEAAKSTQADAGSKPSGLGGVGLLAAAPCLASSPAPLTVDPSPGVQTLVALPPLRPRALKTQQSAKAPRPAASPEARVVAPGQGRWSRCASFTFGQQAAGMASRLQELLAVGASHAATGTAGSTWRERGAELNTVGASAAPRSGSAASQLGLPRTGHRTGAAVPVNARAGTVGSPEGVRLRQALILRASRSFTFANAATHRRSPLAVSSFAGDPLVATEGSRLAPPGQRNSRHPSLLQLAHASGATPAPAGTNAADDGGAPVAASSVLLTASLSHLRNSRLSQAAALPTPQLSAGRRGRRASQAAPSTDPAVLPQRVPSARSLGAQSDSHKRILALSDGAPLAGPGLTRPIPIALRKGSGSTLKVYAEEGANERRPDVAARAASFASVPLASPTDGFGVPGHAASVTCGRSTPPDLLPGASGELAGSTAHSSQQTPLSFVVSGARARVGISVALPPLPETGQLPQAQEFRHLKLRLVPMRLGALAGTSRRSLAGETPSAVPVSSPRLARQQQQQEVNSRGADLVFRVLLVDEGGGAGGPTSSSRGEAVAIVAQFLSGFSDLADADLSSSIAADPDRSLLQDRGLRDIIELRAKLATQTAQAAVYTRDEFLF